MDRTTQIILIIFTAITAVSVVIQASVILGIYIGARKMQKKAAALLEDFRIHVLPILSSTRETVEAISPKVKIITADIAEVTTKLRNQSDHINSAVGDVVNKTQAQAARIDGMVNGTLDQIVNTAGAIQHGLSIPVRQFNGILNGLRAGIDVIRKRTPNHVKSDSDLFV